MKKIVISMLILIFLSFGIKAQNIVKGVVVDSRSEKPLVGVLITVKNTSISLKTGIDGFFILKKIPKGKHIIEILLVGYETQNFPIEISDKTIIDLGNIYMYEDITDDDDFSTITISDDELDSDSSAADNISGLLQSSRDLYLRTAAFEFSSSFYRIKGLDSDNAEVLINGIPMNKLQTGRPEWGNWGGLNTVTRNQEFSNGLAPSTYTFGGVLGSTNINTRASEYRPGTRMSIASSNRSYTGRVMATYSSGLMDNNWAITVSGSRRAGDEGFTDGSFYDANSIFLSIEKKINDNHSINFTSITATNKRGKTSPNTQEVFDLRGIQYNANWGYQNGKLRNSRVKEVIEPILILSHYWNINENTLLTTSVGYQFGKIGNSRIDYFGNRIDGNAVDGNGDPYIVGLGGSNPDPTYYQKLPSFGLRNGYTNVYEMEQEFLNDGQLQWDDLISANIQNNGNSTYVLYEDRNDDKTITINTILDKDINDNITLNAKIQYKKLVSSNFAMVQDLLGGNGYLDVDAFADSFDEKQNNLLNPLHLAKVGDKFKYDFNLNSNVIDAFVQTQFTYNKIDFYLAGRISNTTHQRDGLYKNGGFPNSSFGKSEKMSFTNLGAKGGFTYKISGRHLLNINGGYLTKAPTLRNTFSNSRENNNIVDNLVSENVLSFDASYILRSPKVQAKITGYYTSIKDATEISFFFADGIGGDNTAFVQEILSGIDKTHLGVEFGVEYQITPTIKLKTAGNLGQYTYANNPNLYLTTEKNQRSIDAGFIDGRKDFGEASLKNYKLAGGPQTAYSIGFEYRDPNYWWIGTTVNFFDNAYIDISPLIRSSNFADDGGIPFNDYDPELARELLQQEKFDNYTVVNAIGGKSWKVGDKFISVFASISNIFNTQYKTGGFEQGRNANYRQLRDDKALDIPVFGPRYWYGRGTTYFISTTLRF